MDGTRVVFDFDDRNLAELKRITANAGYPTMGATIHAALQVIGILQEESKGGETQLIVRNPATGSQRVIELSPKARSIVS
jgi:hypothetical protein